MDTIEPYPTREQHVAVLGKGGVGHHHAATSSFYSGDDVAVTD